MNKHNGFTILWFSHLSLKGGLKIPVFQYPIRASQVADLENASDDEHKQECELIALKLALPRIRAAFPKMKLTLLLDGLYANRPVMQLLKEQRCDYIIVRKEKCLTLLKKECDEHTLNGHHKKNCVKRTRVCEGRCICNRKYEWFNSMYLGNEVTTSVLRFEEKREDRNGSVDVFKCEWLLSKRVSARTCEEFAERGRLRWELEDVFNSLKNRGFNLMHDYSRTPRSCFKWQGLSLWAFGIFELFRLSEKVTKRGCWSQIALAEKLLGQLLHSATEIVFPCGYGSLNLQFRYNFQLVLQPEKISEKDLVKEDLLDPLLKPG